MTTKLHWKKVGNEWHTEEQLDGVPDFIIEKQDNAFRVKMRSARQPASFDTLDDAKTWAETV